MDGEDPTPKGGNKQYCGEGTATNRKETTEGGDYGIGAQQGLSNTAAAYISGIQDALGGKSN